MEFSPTINIISMLMAIPPWAAIPFGNIPLQRIGLTIQVVGLVLMAGNTVLLFI